MPLLAATFFPHRSNRDGSFNSICLNCFVTVGDHRTEEELVKMDAQHICKSTPLSRRSVQLESTSKPSK
jgi:hypothetical protein